MTNPKRAEEALRSGEDSRHLHGTADQIECRKQDSETMRGMESRERLALRAAGMGTWDHDFKTATVRCSDTCERILGGYAGAFEGSLEAFLNYVHPLDRDAVVRALRAYSAERVSVVSFRIVKPDGTLRWVQSDSLGLSDESGAITRAIGVIQDVTERKKLEDTLRSSEERLQVVLDNLAEGVTIADSNGSILAMNPAALRLYELEGSDRSHYDLKRFQNMFDVWDMAGRPLEFSDWPLAKLLRGEEVVTERIWVQRKDTGRKWIACYNGTPIRDKDGRILLAALALRDVTADYTTTAELSIANASLRQLSGQLLRIQEEERKRIARELHDGTVQVLSAQAMNLYLLTQSEALKNNPYEQRLARESLSWAKECGRELRTLSHLLYPPALEELGLLTALRSWLDGFEERTGITIDPHLSDPGRLAPEIETALFRIAQEALANVHRHSGSATASIRLSCHGDEIALEVQDSGCGLPPAVLTPGINEVPRLGVGLIGMRERTQHLGGKLQLICTGEGTTVRAFLPRVVPL